MLVRVSFSGPPGYRLPKGSVQIISVIAYPVGFPESVFTAATVTVPSLKKSHDGLSIIVWFSWSKVPDGQGEQLIEPVPPV